MMNADYEKFREYAEKFREIKTKPHTDATCPNCGYCPHCGRGQQTMPHYPSYPYHPSPWWQVQPWYGPTWTVTCGTSPISGNVTSLLSNGTNYQ